jgi:hypothetical protein
MRLNGSPVVLTIVACSALCGAWPAFADIAPKKLVISGDTFDASGPFQSAQGAIDDEAGFIAGAQVNAGGDVVFVAQAHFVQGTGDAHGAFLYRQYGALDWITTTASVLSIDSNDNVAFRDLSIWTGTNREVICTEDAPTPLPGATFLGPTRMAPATNRKGEIAFARYWTTGGKSWSDEKEGLWLWNGQTIEPVAYATMQAPGLPDGITFNGFQEVALNDAGSAVFRATLAGPGVTGKNDAGVWLASGGLLQLVAQSGVTPPGVFDGGVFTRFDNVALSPGGIVAFQASVGGDRTSTPYVSLGIWAGTPSAMHLEVSDRDGNYVCPNFGHSYAPRDDGRVVLVQVQETTECLMIGTRENMQVIATPGGAAAGTAGVFESVGAVAFDAEGRIVLEGLFHEDDGTVTGFVGRGIWAGTPGNLQLVVKLRQSFEVAPGDVRVVGWYRTESVGPQVVPPFSGPVITPDGAFLVAIQFEPELGVRDRTEGLFLAQIGGSNPPRSESRISVSEATLDFGQVEAGQSATSILTVSNVGSVGLVLQGVTSSGSPFAVDLNGGDHPLGTRRQLAPGESGTLAVTYTPPVAGDHTGTIAIMSNDAASPTLVVRLHGVGTNASHLESMPVSVVDSNLAGGVCPGIGGAALALTLAGLYYARGPRIPNAVGRRVA